jgi:magnesium transporter
MYDRLEVEPWQHLREIIEAHDAPQLAVYLDSLSPSETARAVSHLASAEHTALLTLLAPRQAAEVISDVQEHKGADMLEELPPAHAAAIVDELNSDRQADLLGEIGPENSEAILQHMAPEEAEDVRRLLVHRPDSAGGVMITEFLSLPAHLTAGQVRSDMTRRRSEYAHYDIQYVYLTDAHNTLVGILRLRDLLFADPSLPVSEFMVREPFCFPASATLEELDEFFSERAFRGVPVTDKAGHILGVVRRSALKTALEARAGKSLLSFSGIVGGQEQRSMPTLSRSSRRLSWLSVNIVLNIIAASVIALYEETLVQVITLAVFLPIVSDMSGCSGNQAVAVSMRELTMGLVKPRDLAWVLWKEFQIGILNGTALGIMLGGAAALWKSNLVLGTVVGVSLALNTLVAVSLGGSIPLLLQRLKLDPALVSGPILTTVTDMCGFFLVLSLASASLRFLL